MVETTTDAPSIEMIELRSLSEHPQNPRKTFDAERLAELVESVRQQGVLNPLLVRPLDPAGLEGGYQILAGARRFRAAAKAGLTQVPAIVRDLDDTAAFEVVVVDNLQRADLHPLEEAYGYHQLMRPSVGYSVGRVADRVGRSVSYVYDRLKLLSLSKEAQGLFRSDQITAGHAVILARLTPADQKRAIGKPGYGPLLKHERTLFEPQDRREREHYKPISVRELQAWVDEHVRFDAAATDPMLFPETALALDEAKEEALKVVPITHDHFVYPDAKDGSTRTYGPRSWKRAGGAGSKKCDRAVQGVIVVGAGRGRSFPVCIDKKRCAVHWPAEVRAAKRRQKATAAPKGTAAAAQQSKKETAAQAAAQRKREEDAKRSRQWADALPRVAAEVAAAVRRLPTGGDGPLAEEILEFLGDQLGHIKHVEKRLGLEVRKEAPLGNTADALVRHVALWVLFDRLEMADGDITPLLKKRLGVDAEAILAEVAAAPEAGTKKRAAKKARGRRG